MDVNAHACMLVYVSMRVYGGVNACAYVRVYPCVRACSCACVSARMCVLCVCACMQGRLHKKRAGGEISQKATKDTILTSNPATDLIDDHWRGVYLKLWSTPKIGTVAA